MVAGVERQHPPLELRVPHAVDGVRRLAELLAIVDQAHIGPHVRHRIQLAVDADIGNARVIPKTRQLLRGVADPPGHQRLQQPLLDIVVDLGGIGGDDVEVAP